MLLRLLYRSIREPAYRQSIDQRFGCFRSRHAGEVIWIHAVSAGETVAAVPLVRRLIDAGYPCLVTNMTPTGRDRVRVLLSDLVENCYAPYDLPGSVNRFIANNKPRLMLTVDTELWPNTINACSRRGIPTMLVNGRMSEKSARGYRRLPALSKPMLQAMSRLAVQTRAHAERFEALGVSSDRIAITGSIKFDSVQRDGFEQRFLAARTLLAGRPVFLAASTHEGEEAAILQALVRIMKTTPNVLLVLAPRHTHRTDKVKELIENGGFRPVLFTSGTTPSADNHVLLVDTMGELDVFFPLALVAFIGGSLVPVGGHNLLEAVQAGTVVVMGPHLRNIDDIARQFMDAQAMCVVSDANELAQDVARLMEDSDRRATMVAAANKVYARNRGALDRVFILIEETLADGPHSVFVHR